MLFRTVYGPELESIYYFVDEESTDGKSIHREDIHLAFVPRQVNGELGSTQNVDDALLFLRSARLLDDYQGFSTTPNERNLGFRLHLLGALRRIERGEQAPSHNLDPLYTMLLNELFIKPDLLFVANVHRQANQLRQVNEVGGLSREKTQAWQRVMSFLGVGRRVAGGFQCVYAPDLVLDIFRAWSSRRGALQAFCEEHFDAFLPFDRQQDGDLAIALQAPLDHLALNGDLEMFSLQDSPSKPYFGERRLRGFRLCEGASDDD